MSADPGLSEELIEKIVAFVEREAGRDAPLSADDEAIVRRMLERDPDVRQLADDLRANNQELDGLFNDTSAIQVPDKLVALIQGHGAKDVLIASRPDRMAAQMPGESKVEPFPSRQPAVPGFGYGKLAAAASFAFVVSAAAFLYVYSSLQDERLRLEERLAAAETMEFDRQQLADAATEIENLRTVTQPDAGNEIDLTELQHRYNDLLAENERLNALVVERTNAFAQVDEQRGQILADLSSMTAAMQVERDAEVIVRSVDSSEVSNLDPEQPVTTESILADLSIEQQALQSRIASLEAENLDLMSDLDLTKQNAERSEQKATILQSNLVLAENTRAATARRLAVLQSDLSASKSWLGQIAQYHRVYSSTDRQHLVEVGADQEEDIEQWFATMLDRPVTVPDLSEHGLIFQGGRLLGVNEKPVTQLIYLDAEDRPLALCMIASEKEAMEPSQSVDRDLNLIEWRDGRHGYALVGWSDPALLEALAETIRPVFDL